MILFRRNEPILQFYFSHVCYICNESKHVSFYFLSELTTFTKRAVPGSGRSIVWKAVKPASTMISDLPVM